MSIYRKETQTCRHPPDRPDGVHKSLAPRCSPRTCVPGMLWGKILRTPHAHARIRNRHVGGRLPGVQAVVTAAEFPIKV